MLPLTPFLEASSVSTMPPFSRVSSTSVAFSPGIFVELAAKD